MLRFRRYRYYVFFAAIVVLLLYRVTQNSEQWESVSASIPLVKAPPKSSLERGFGLTNKQSRPASAKSETGFNSEDDEPRLHLKEKTGKEPEKVKIPNLKPTTGEDTVGKLDTPNAATTTNQSHVRVYDKEEAAKTTTAPLISIPDKNVGQGAKGVGGPPGKGAHGAPGAHKPKTQSATTTIHWEKFPEHFPVPKDEIIPLPTGKPKPILAIQYDFEKESAQAREERLDRLAKVKAEMVRGWNGYMTYAKGHDELSPVSKKFRNPFCGWAATLVDALDTLWIMGMKDEFEEALLVVEKIDFTTSEYRTEIPVFETTIRYLGGLVAAYDVSGGKAGGHDILLEKAIELAEILMDVFDTPNRMPVLYYNWKPAFAKLPKRAQAGVSVAELGSLAMEFTRLAQITKEDRYYDAVARITDAFYEWQERGTTIPGIFPERVDATGCNRTAALEIAAKEAEVEKLREAGQKAYDSQNAKNSKPGVEGSSQGKSVKGGQSRLGSRAVGTPNDDGTNKVKIEHNGEEMYAPSKKTISDENDVDQAATTVDDRDSTSVKPETKKKKDTCVPQGLTAGSWSANEQYSMGGSQDSTYEYFPKQWLLLGGLEPKYKTLHAKVTAAVKKWLLFRPMIPGDRDILFSAKINTRGSPEVDATTEWEVTHLTCFIGGMFGMGGKIFDVPEDVEIGKRLTDGCVWAYENTPSGIMPEGATVVPCAEVNNCHWNETLYWQYLDPLYETRLEQMADYQKQHKEWKSKKAQQAKMKGHKNLGATSGGATSDSLVDEKFGSSQGVTTQKTGSKSSRIQKRAPPAPPPSRGASTDSTRKSSQVATLEDALDINGGSDSVVASIGDNADQVPLTQEELDIEYPEPERPMSHEQYVESRIEAENLPPGFVSAHYHSYILRPEAIESVWYMYRITGDTTWQDKGWKMFNAIVSQTRTESGNSAIDNVLLPNSDKTDEMESFWLAETLKYFYLLYSDPSLISLDEWVLNTEAHPFKRPI
ncbi:glycoside hydrolase family 47 protein [Annulohypoxylon maeteangense]|uniref:glycoside hydrolase family 47 protein n=1 Tax=Annulohypoxylon maeteangense TaxID=1927788 RepID=UPI002007F9A8|nr:glycoside hydrolase family 47 protein [Annulohypoxylon maeteangense]KAI0886758.1 glycoside hydrolase family 47 protein [Annulohypoxylon maeteangense]